MGRRAGLASASAKAAARLAEALRAKAVVDPPTAGSIEQDPAYGWNVTTRPTEWNFVTGVRGTLATPGPCPGEHDSRRVSRHATSSQI